MEDLLKKILIEESESMFDALYENVEQTGKIVDEKFKKGVKEYEVNKEKRQDIILKEISHICNNKGIEEKMKRFLIEYKEAIYLENAYYNKQHYIQGIKDGMILLANAFKTK